MNPVATDRSIYPQRTRHIALRTSAHCRGGRLRNYPRTVFRKRPTGRLDRRGYSTDQERPLGQHWDVLQDEATKAQSKSGLPMFGEEFSKEGEIR